MHTLKLENYSKYCDDFTASCQVNDHTLFSIAVSFQACTEIFLTAGTNNVTDFFPVLPFTPQIRNAYCKNKWGVVPRDTWADVEFWGDSKLHRTNRAYIL